MEAPAPALSDDASRDVKAVQQLPVAVGVLLQVTDNAVKILRHNVMFPRKK